MAQQFFEEACRAARNKDETQTVDWLQKAAEADHCEAMTFLGLMYQDGHGGLTNDELQAARWFRKAADKGSARAMLELGIMCETGRAGASLQDSLRLDSHFFEEVISVLPIVLWATANLIIRKTTASRQPDANESAPNPTIVGFPEEAPRAVNWIQKAADAGDPYALTCLGDIAAIVESGLAQDDIQAVNYYLRAAEARESFALRGLGTMYAAGRGGLPKDLAQAAKCLARAGEPTPGDMFQPAGGGFSGIHDYWAVRLVSKSS